MNPLSLEFDSLSKALCEAVRIVASKTTKVTAEDVAETWHKLCLGAL